MNSTNALGPDVGGEPFEYEWNYRGVIGKLNFLEKSTRPDISAATNTCARFMQAPTKKHGEAVKRIGRYLLGTRDKGIYLKPNKRRGFECYVDADFCGGWDKDIAMDQPDTAKSRYGYIVKVYNAPIYWSSRLQTIIALSTAESEYIGLSNAARYLLGTIYLMEEINAKFHPLKAKPTIKCTIFEDNNSALEIAKVPKMRPRTRHINVQYHHFRNEVASGRMAVERIDTTNQEADMLTKSLNQDTLQKLRNMVMGW